MKQTAVKVENKSEFEALMKHYKDKGWNPAEPSSWDSFTYNETYNCLRFQDGFTKIKPEEHHDTAIIDFATFSQLTGVTVTKEVIVELKGEGTAKVTPGFVYFSNVTRGLYEAQIEEIYTALQSLKN